MADIDGADGTRDAGTRGVTAPASDAATAGCARQIAAAEALLDVLARERAALDTGDVHGVEQAAHEKLALAEELEALAADAVDAVETTVGALATAIREFRLANVRMVAEVQRFNALAAPAGRAEGTASEAADVAHGRLARHHPTRA